MFISKPVLTGFNRLFKTGFKSGLFGFPKPVANPSAVPNGKLVSIGTMPNGKLLNIGTAPNG